ncbi:unnamed protein product [Closterium sp. NIES-54]
MVTPQGSGQPQPHVESPSQRWAFLQDLTSASEESAAVSQEFQGSPRPDSSPSLTSSLSSSTAPPTRSLLRLLLRCQLSDDVALQALEGRLQLLDAHRALSSVRCQQFVTAFEGPQRVAAAFEAPHRLISNWGDGADAAFAGNVAPDVREPTNGGRTEADFADENSCDGDSNGEQQSSPHSRSWMADLAYYREPTRSNSLRPARSPTSARHLASTRSLTSSLSFTSVPSRGFQSLGSTPILGSTPSYTSNALSITPRRRSFSGALPRNLLGPEHCSRRRSFSGAEAYAPLPLHQQQQPQQRHLCRASRHEQPSHYQHHPHHEHHYHHHHQQQQQQQQQQHNHPKPVSRAEIHCSRSARSSHTPRITLSMWPPSALLHVCLTCHASPPLLQLEGEETGPVSSPDLHLREETGS